MGNILKSIFSPTAPERSSDLDKITHPLDADIKRDRFTRFIVFVSAMTLIVAVTTIALLVLGSSLYNSAVMEKISVAIGLATGLALAYYIATVFFFLKNDTVGMFVTQDTLQSLLGSQNVNVYYGPGFHISFPWEQRIANNNISLEEATNEFEFDVICSDGTLTVKGSYRMRPDMQRPVAFLTGVAAVADEISDLIKSDIFSRFQGKTVIQAIGEVNELNETLKNFTRNHPVEVAFGVQISDVTVSQLLPSKELMRTISAKAEAAAIRSAILTVLGVQSEAEFDQKRNSGLITNDDVERARYAAMSMSGNLEGVEVKRNEYVVSLNGIDSDAVKAVAQAAPAIAAILGNKNQPGQNSRPKNK